MLEMEIEYEVFTSLPQNPGYYDIVGEDVSVWHVRNNIPLKHWTIATILRYHTETRFLTLNGGNLYQLFKVHGTSKMITDTQ